MTSRSSYRGRISHERNQVPVPPELRLELHRRFTSSKRAAAGLGVSETTAIALLAPYGMVRLDILQRVRERLYGVL